MYPWLANLEEKQKKASETSDDEDEGYGQGHVRKAATTWIHCAVGPKLEPGEEVEESDKSSQVCALPFQHDFKD